MYQGQFVFSQIMDRLPWRRFQTCVDRYRGDTNVQTFKCADYFRVMAFAQLTYRESLRDIVACLNAVPGKMYHLGIRSGVSRNNLSNATKQRDWRIFADFAQILIEEARCLYQSDPSPLGVSIFAGEQIEHHFALGIVQGEDKTGQGRSLMAASADEAVLGGTEVITIDNDGSQTGNEGRLFTVILLEGGAEALETIPNEFGGNIRFEVIGLLIDGGDRNGHVGSVFQVGFVERRGAFECHVKHECHESGEKKRFFVLFFGGSVEEFVKLLGGQETLQGGTQGNGGGGFRNESVKFFSKIEHSRFLSREGKTNPDRRARTQGIIAFATKIP